MFEEYLEDARCFETTAKQALDDREARRLYRASIFCCAAALESFVNHIGSIYNASNVFTQYEIAFLIDQRFGLNQGKFEILNQTKYNKIEDKLRYLLEKFVPGFDFMTEPSWSSFMEVKSLRDQLLHPRQDDDTVEITYYSGIVKRGVNAVIQLMNTISVGIFGKPLRQKLLDLK